MEIPHDSEGDALEPGQMPASAVEYLISNNHLDPARRAPAAEVAKRTYEAVDAGARTTIQIVKDSIAAMRAVTDL